MILSLYTNYGKRRKKVAIKMQYYFNQFAANYDCSAYGIGSYNSASCTTSTDNGGLLPTGENMAIGLGGGALLVVVAVVLLIKTLRKKRA